EQPLQLLLRHVTNPERTRLLQLDQPNGLLGRLRSAPNRKPNLLRVPAELVDGRVEVEIDRRVTGIRVHTRALRRLERHVFDVYRLRRELRRIRIGGLTVRSLCFIHHNRVLCRVHRDSYRVELTIVHDSTTAAETLLELL